MRLAHLSLAVADQQRSRRFYETFFGFDGDGEPDAEGCLHLTDADDFEPDAGTSAEGLAFTLASFRDQGRRPAVGPAAPSAVVRRGVKTAELFKSEERIAFHLLGSRRLSGGGLLEQSLGTEGRNSMERMASPILVTGGTGTLGRIVVDRLREAGREVRVLSRKSREGEKGVAFVTGDLDAGEGAEGAVEGVDVIVHCAGSAKGDEEKARNLVRAASRVGAPHVVYISVVGADRIPVVSRVDRNMFGYFASKLAAERVVAESGLPWTTLRATQFYDLILMVAQQMARMPVIPIPSGFRFQPGDAGEVADRLVELAFDAPAGLVPDMAGPKVYGAKELLRGYLRAAHRRRPILPIPLPGKAAAAFRAGGALAPEQAVGRRTWEEFLADRVSSSAAVPEGASAARSS